MFGIGMSEMVIILAVALLVFGPNKLPEIAKSIAKGMRELRRAGDDLRASVDLDLDDRRPRPAPRTVPPPDTPPAALITGSELAAGHIIGGEHGEHDDNAAHHADMIQAGRDAMAAAATGQTKPKDDVWPRPAEGTLAQGSMTDDVVDVPEAADATGGDPKVG